ncbi:dihydrofolate reductase family protein [Phytomonospora endophytica]|uniref:Dihydrofolate reductase n=1 Tax=Phytomonospora endophytica TaxID=714109 RepID=A0A841FAW4_9ACTN|nr:dihydrofolate reductase family protein [Phytomonospora endophytica]MBB6032425.1 dihydrofolate reductase [Phytomonospora endophytica]GIG66428.1 deaminase reductase [Phytomonospora endophytica]
MGFTSTVFIGTSLDGFIARENGDIAWLTGRGEAAGDMGFFAFLDTVDTIVLGRTTFETVLAFGEDAWPYGDRRVAVLSTTLPEDADPRVTVYRDLDSLVAALEEEGAEHVYPDGGRLIQSFLRAGLVDRFMISTAPVLIGSGHRLFGPLDADVSLTPEWTKTHPGGFVQTSWVVVKE